MIAIRMSSSKTGARLAVVVAAAAFAAVACGSSGGSGSGSGAAMHGGSAMGGGKVTVETHSGPMGTYLTDASGRTLYLFARDSTNKSNCSGGCATFWPPLTVKGSAKASGGVQAGMLGTITRSDGSKQVTYAGHPLYYYKQDTKAGQTSGQGLNLQGGKWWLVGPNGKGITGSHGGSTSPSPTKSKSKSKGGGGGGWA